MPQLSTWWLSRISLALVFPFLATSAAADCSSALQSCSADCMSSATSGLVVGLAGAFGRNSAAYEQGQRDLRKSQVCNERCTARNEACLAAESPLVGREPLNRRQDHGEAAADQRAYQSKITANIEEERRLRANRVVTPPVTGPLALKDGGPLLQEAQSQISNGNSQGAVYIYKLVLKQSSETKHLQAARSGLRSLIVNSLATEGATVLGAYDKQLLEAVALGLFSLAEQAQLAAMAPSAGASADQAATDYLTRHPGGALASVAQAMVHGLPTLRAQARSSGNRSAAAAIGLGSAAAVNASARFIPKDPSRDYNGQSCGYFTRSNRSADGKDVLHINGTQICYGGRFYQCTSGFWSREYEGGSCDRFEDASKYRAETVER